LIISGPSIDEDVIYVDVIDVDECGTIYLLNIVKIVKIGL